MSALDTAEKEFLEKPSNTTAGAFMAALMDAEVDGEIDDDDWLDGLSMIRDYLERS